MSNRADLAEKMEIIGLVFEIDGMSDLLNKFDAGTDENGEKKKISLVKFNSVVIQVSALLLKENKGIADKLIQMNAEIDDDAVQDLDDVEYAMALRTAILQDVLGFFASSPSTDGQK